MSIKKNKSNPIRAIPERNPRYIKGLTDFCKYINGIIPTKDLTILEVGAWTGAGSVVFAEYFKEVHCIDIWNKDKDCGITVRYNINKVEDIFNKRMHDHNNIYKYKMYWEDFAKKLKTGELKAPEMFDVVYVDMNKIFEHNLECLRAFYPITKKFIGGHDYEHRFPGVVKAVNKFIGKPQFTFPDTSWIVSIPNPDHGENSSKSEMKRINIMKEGE